MVLVQASSPQSCSFGSGDNGHEVDPPSFVFGGSNFLVGPLSYSVLKKLATSCMHG